MLSRAGNLSNITVGAPATHGFGVFGIHGVGVNTPAAAEVAAAVVGFAMLEHIPNGIIFTIGTWSMIFAANWYSVCTRCIGNTWNMLGAAPKVHVNCAVMHVCMGIISPHN
jgi:hypothetical protein